MKALMTRPLGIVALKLLAETIYPVLTVDKKQKLDHGVSFGFYHWSVKDEESPELEKKIILKNETKADLIFNVSVEGPFEIVDTKTNTGSIHPLA